MVRAAVTTVCSIQWRTWTVVGKRSAEEAAVVIREAAQELIEEIGANGPECFEDTVRRAVERLRLYRRALRVVASSCARLDELKDTAADVLKGNEDYLKTLEVDWPEGL